MLMASNDRDPPCLANVTPFNVPRRLSKKQRARIDKHWQALTGSTPTYFTGKNRNQLSSPHRDLDI